METDGPGRRVAFNVRTLRDVRGLSVRELSARLGVLGVPLLPSGITKLEQGQRRIDVDELIALAVALQVNPSRLLLPDTASEADVALTPAFTVPAWAAWAWADAYSPLPALSEEGDLIVGQPLEDFEMHSRPVEVRQELRHPLMRAVNILRGSASRVIRQAIETHDEELVTSLLTTARRNVDRVSAELDVIEEEAARG
jgi:transcriptional regulator with XRE-family HTH domain